MKKPSYDHLKEKIHPVASRPFQMTALIYGRSGAGKTHLAATFPKPILLIDTMEGGTDTIREENEIDILEVEDWESWVGAYWMLRQEDAPKEYATVVVDQITKLQDMAITQAVKEAGKSPGSTLTMRDWGNVSGMLKGTLFNLIDLMKVQHKHLILIGHERAFATDEDADEAIDPSVGVRLMPSVSTAINGAVDIIGHSFIREDFVGPQKVREVEYCLRIGPHGVYTTKLRRPSSRGPIPEYLDDPSFDMLADLIRPAPQPTRKRKRKVKK